MEHGRDTWDVTRAIPQVVLGGLVTHSAHKPPKTALTHGGTWNVTMGKNIEDSHMSVGAFAFLVFPCDGAMQRKHILY